MLMVSVHSVKRFRQRVAPVSRRSAMATLARALEDAGVPDDGEWHWLETSYNGKPFQVVSRGTAAVTVVPGRW